MKQMMKQMMLIAVMIAVWSVAMQADNTVMNFVKNVNQAGGLIDNEVIYIYWDKKVGKEKDPTALNLLKYIAQKKICEKKDTREIVEDLGMSVKFIYLYKGDATIVKIDNCKGVTTEHKSKKEVKNVPIEE
jgi:DNA invertase Pin-like site-specific DNA recombinase